VNRIKRILTHHFKLGMINHDPSGTFLGLPVKDYFVPGRDHLVHEGHIEPTTSHPGKAPAPDIFDDRFVKALPSKSFPLSIDHGSSKTDRRATRLRREGVKATSILIALGKPFQQIEGIRKSRREERFLLTAFQKRKLFERGHSFSSEARTC
jgi:hypothetical protein